MTETAEEIKSRYEAIKKELLGAIPKKRAIDRKLAQVEAQIFTLEGSYLSETGTHSGGNLIQGFENYLKNQTTGRRRTEAAEHDRIFSTSSLTYTKSLELMSEEAGGDEDFAKQTTPGVTTVIVPPATRNEGLTAAQQNKLTRDKEYQRRKRASTRRSVGTISDDESVTTSSGRRPTKRARLADDD